MATNVTDDNFQAEVIESDETTLVDFWAPWCGPCRAVSPVLEEIDAERSDVRVVKLNTDENQKVAGTYGIMSLPTMLVFKNGAPVGQIVGALPKPRLNKEIDSILGV
jgi:thioredoxin 1